LQYTYRQILISIGLMQLFVLFSTYFPEYYYYLYITFFTITTVIMMVYVGKRARPLLKDLEAIMHGRTLCKIEKKELQEIMLKDPEYLEIMRRRLKIGVIQWILFIIIFLLFITPFLREWLRYGVGNMLSYLLRDVEIPPIIGGVEKLSLLILNELVYALLMLIPLIMFRASRSLTGGDVDVLIPSSYIITDKGIVLDNRIPLKFPLKIVNYKTKRRRYLEIELKEEVGKEFMQAARKVRLYSKSPGKLWELIRSVGVECSTE